MMHLWRVQGIHVEHMSHKPLHAGIMTMQALPGRAHQVTQHLSREVKTLSIVLTATVNFMGWIWHEGTWAATGRPGEGLYQKTQALYQPSLPWAQ